MRAVISKKSSKMGSIAIGTFFTVRDHWDDSKKLISVLIWIGIGNILRKKVQNSKREHLVLHNMIYEKAFNHIIKSLLSIPRIRVYFRRNLGYNNNKSKE